MKRQLLLGLTAALSFDVASAAPLKVYILAGQSNMEGHARIETFDYIGDDPALSLITGQFAITTDIPAT